MRHGPDDHKWVAKGTPTRCKICYGPGMIRMVCACGAKKIKPKPCGHGQGREGR